MVLCDLNSVGKNQDLVEKQQQQHKWLVNWKEWQNSNDHFIGDIAKLYFIQYVICTTPDLLLLLKLLLKSIYSSLPISGLLSLAFCGLSTRKSFVNRHRLCVCVCVCVCSYLLRSTGCVRCFAVSVSYTHLTLPTKIGV